jgi:hypothetical protein
VSPRGSPREERCTLRSFPEEERKVGVLESCCQQDCLKQAHCSQEEKAFERKEEEEAHLKKEEHWMAAGPRCWVPAPASRLAPTAKDEHWRE